MQIFPNFEEISAFMIDLSTKYMGFNLRNPIIAGSSTLTSRIESIRELVLANVSAVVLKSLFEEDLMLECSPESRKFEKSGNYPKGAEYGGIRSRHPKMEAYVRLIGKCKSEFDIPIIASINCTTFHEWIPFAKRVEEAGADAIELNMFVLPSDPMRSSIENEQVYFDILTDLRRHIKIPLTVKISPYFSGLTKMALKLSWTGIQGMVLFNRFFTPDIDIENQSIVAGSIYSSPEEMAISLRWVGLLSDRVMCDLCGSTGIHNSEGILKMLLAGARAVEITSVLYQKGPAEIGIMLKGIEDWMQRKGYSCIKEFNGILSLKKAENPADYERFQYLQHINVIEKEC